MIFLYRRNQLLRTLTFVLRLIKLLTPPFLLDFLKISRSEDLGINLVLLSLPKIYGQISLITGERSLLDLMKRDFQQWNKVS
jgi:hypothetical protein